MDVGIRELRNHLSRYVAQVQEGQEIVITDHGKAVARIVPVRGGRKLDQLIADGLVTPAKRRGKPRWMPRPDRPQAMVSDLVIEERKEGW
jgi:prevent-host-death family protein